MEEKTLKHKVYDTCAALRWRSTGEAAKVDFMMTLALRF